MAGEQGSYRRIAVGEDAGNAVTVGIEAGSDGRPFAAVWWPASGDVDGDEAQYDDVASAFAAAEAARQLHGFAEVVVVLQDDLLWNPAWGEIAADRNREPIGDVSDTDLNSREVYNLARGIEGERDA
ncbi:hypothetical protein [Devosia sp. 1566]|uniref:hypothetical protein n=1 Tax=Devosia sp. 1566 TaxID=2499144 RepID=UPI000FDB0256|nr:hypothetical protein [Devosia sp. 1566]